MKNEKIILILIMIYVCFGLGIIPVISMLIIGCTGNFIPVLILGISLLVYALKLK
jgi:hypothetical protein